METIYIEEEISTHPKTLDILQRYPNARRIPCEKYTEIFNRKEQNFRLQKIKPALILAKKHGNFLHPIPESFGLGAKHNFYFSHLLNCPFDCSYCFLQGMYSSANFVLFVNFEDFKEAIREKIDEIKGESVCFFSGYDGDSLAMEPLTNFVEEFLPLFERQENASLEIRTKSIAIKPFLNCLPVENAIIAYTLNPELISKQIERKTPPFSARIKTIAKLQKLGWNIGLRFDPVIYCKDYQTHYQEMFDTVFETIDHSLLHSITLGQFRMPKNVEKKMTKLSPFDTLLASNQKSEIMNFCYDSIVAEYPKEKVFLCQELS